MSKSVTEIEAYKGLANAIILRACEDFSDGRYGRGVVEFIRSPWFLTLSRGRVDPETLIRFLRQGGYKAGGEPKVFNDSIV